MNKLAADSPVTRRGGGCSDYNSGLGLVVGSTQEMNNLAHCRNFLWT
jgi:hypothetical protein